MSPSPSPSPSNDDDEEHNNATASDDDRPLISDLLLKHSKEIESVRNKIKDEELYKKDTAAENDVNDQKHRRRYDDIWILRYVLSHGKDDLEGAAEAAIQTMVFREEKKLNHQDNCDLRYRMQNIGDSHDTKRFKSLSVTTAVTAAPLPGWEKLNDCSSKNTSMMIQPNLDRGPILIVDMSTFNMDLVHEKFTHDELLETNLYTNECIFQVVDEVTRRTGKLTKFCKIIDMDGWQLSKVNRSYIKADAAVSKELENMFPQLVGTVLLVNAPSWISIIWSFAKMFMPQRAISKVDILPAMKKTKKNSSSSSSSSSSSTSSKSQMKQLTPFLKYISAEHLPEKYGGQNKQWPLECFGRIYQKQILDDK